MTEEKNIDTSIIVLVHNQHDIIRDVVLSLAHQKQTPSTEIIFIDDASSHDTLDMLKSTLSECRFTRARLIIHRHKKGCAFRLKQGIAEAKGNYIFVTDGLSVLAENALFEMKSVMDETNADIVRGKGICLGLSSSELLGKSVTEPASYFVSDNPLSTVLSKKDLNGFCLMFQRRILDKMTALDEENKAYDLSFILKSAVASDYMAVLKEPVFYEPIRSLPLEKDKRLAIYDSFMVKYRFAQSFPLSPMETFLMERHLLKEGMDYIRYASLQDILPHSSQIQEWWTDVRRKFSLPAFDKYFASYLLAELTGLGTEKTIKLFASFIKRNMRLLRGQLKREDVLILPITEKDAQEVKFYLQQVSNETRFLETDPSEWRVDTKELASCYAETDNRKKVYLKAVVNKKIVGICSMICPKQKRIFHNTDLRISVLRNYWGRSVATYLLENAFAWAEKNDIKRIQILVNAQNRRASALFKRFGFVYEGRLKKAIKVGGKYYDVYLLTKFIY